MRGQWAGERQPKPHMRAVAACVTHGSNPRPTRLQVGGGRFGSRLATDGASASYWLSVGRTDALLDVTLSSTTLVHKLMLTWEYPARDVLVLFSADAAGEDWQLGGTP